jgi:hypothetical protein
MAVKNICHYEISYLAFNLISYYRNQLTIQYTILLGNLKNDRFLVHYLTNKDEDQS